MIKTKTSREYKSVLIVGGGPAGAALGTFLARAGCQVALFDLDSRPELIVGESLIPATIPVIRELGVEEEVRSISVYKPGATFYVRPEMPLDIDFSKGNGTRPSYAYNVPRKEFDAILLQNAERSGVKVFRERYQLESKNDLGSQFPEIRLAESCEQMLQKAGISKPDLFVDASGRAREFSKLLGISAKKGKRNDLVRFAHLEGVAIERPGNIHVNRLSRGWSWRIPLPGKVSVGVVMGAANWKALGKTPEEQYDRLLTTEPTLLKFTAGARRITEIASYSNYQLVSDRLYGPNWVLLGDAAGFVDPIFSSGLDLTLNGAVRCANAILSGSRDSFRDYEKEQLGHISAWQNLVERFYDGSLFGLIRASSLSRERRIWKHVVPFLELNTAQTIAGTLRFDSFRYRTCKFFLDKGYGAKFGTRLAIR